MARDDRGHRHTCGTGHGRAASANPGARVNVELASPTQFIPELPEWRERSRFIERAGALDVFHFDLYSQALYKLERAFDQDLEDVRAMIARGLVDPARARALYDRIEPELYRFPAIEPAAFRVRVERELARI